MLNRDGMLTIFGGSVLAAFGFVALTSSIYLNNATQLETGPYLRLWSLTYLTLILGFVVIVAGFLVAADGTLKRNVGGLIGVIGSLFGGMNALFVVITTISVSSSITGFSSPQFSTASILLLFGAMLALFVGFPMGMAGSAGGVMAKEHTSAAS